MYSAHPCRLFSLAEIQSATKDFDDELVIGHGGFGKVYKAQISSEEGCHVVAVKRLDSMSRQGELEFRAEIDTLSKLRHCHLVSLIGYCDDNNEMILVYEYMPNGTLYHHLHKAETPLNWVQRLKIAIGAGCGLDYLHTGVGTRHGIIHRDVKSSNILLDENWDALISDFGLSKIGPINQSLSYVDASVKGTFGYLDPEYFYTRRLTRKTDVFAFGVVLFELLSGRLAVDIRNGEEQCSLVRWAQKCVKERKLDQMIDLNIRGTIFPKCLRRFAQIAYHCLLSVPKERPTMTTIVASLQAILELQQKNDNFANSLGTMRFSWKIHKYLASMTKQNSDQTTSSSTNKGGDDHGEIHPHKHRELLARDLKMFTYDELKCASRDFGNDMCLGKRVHGAVYKGWVAKMTYSPCMHDTGLPIVIKRLNSYNHFDPDILKEFCHPNLVKLIGYCFKGEQLFLVHEFMNNGNLKDLMWSGAIAQLPLVVKVKIGVGIARAIIFLQKTQNEVRADPYHSGTVGEHRLHRHKILLDEDFTAKLLDYDVTKSVNGHYPNNNDLLYDAYYPGFKPLSLQINLYGFTVVLAEVLTGRLVFYENEVQKMDDFLLQLGIMSLSHIAKSCFEMCDDVDSESKVLTMLEECEKYIPAIQNAAFTATNKSYISIREMYTMKGHIDSVIKFKGLDMDTSQLHYSV